MYTPIHHHNIPTTPVPIFHLLLSLVLLVLALAPLPTRATAPEEVPFATSPQSTELCGGVSNFTDMTDSHTSPATFSCQDIGQFGRYNNGSWSWDVVANGTDTGTGTGTGAGGRGRWARIVAALPDTGSTFASASEAGEDGNGNGNRRRSDGDPRTPPDCVLAVRYDGPADGGGGGGPAIASMGNDDVRYIADMVVRSFGIRTRRVEVRGNTVCRGLAISWWMRSVVGLDDIEEEAAEEGF